MSENELALPQNNTLITAETLDAFDGLTNSTEFIPRIQLMAGQSSAVQDGKANVGEYALIASKDSVTALGKEVDALVIAMRLKALQIDSDGALAFYNPNSEGFKKIMEISLETSETGCMCGPEFLLWIPRENQFCTFFMSSKSQRKVAPQLKSYIDVVNNKPGAVTLRVQIADSKKYKSKWPVPVFTKCSTPFNMPAPDDYSNVLNKFLNPKDSNIETVVSTSDNRVR